MNLTAEKINAATAAEFERLRGLGYEPDGCFVDLGETAETVLAAKLREKEYGCVIIGAGVGANPKYFVLFEKLLNVVHELAPEARIGFNRNPTDTLEAGAIRTSHGYQPGLGLHVTQAGSAPPRHHTGFLKLARTAEALQAQEVLRGGEESFRG